MPLKARYTGVCHNCDKSIELGDVIRQDYDNVKEGWRAVHDECGYPAEGRPALVHKILKD